MSRGFDWVFWLAGGAVWLGGLALLAWSLFADRPRGRRRCPRCWYDLTGSPGLTCSECGHAARRERSLHKIRRRWRSAAAALLLVAAGYEISVTPRIRTCWRWSGWRGAIPTTALVAARPWLDDNLQGCLNLRMFGGASWWWQRAWYARHLESDYREAQGRARGEALEAIGLVGSAARGCLPTVFTAARDQDPSVRAGAAYAIGQIARDHETSLSRLVDLLGDADAGVRHRAAHAIFKFAREERGGCAAAAPVLAERLDDESDWVRLWSAMALCLITGDPGPAVSSATTALGSTTQDLAIVAVSSLGRLDPALEGVVPTLCTAAAHADSRVRMLAVQGLMQAGPLAAEAVPVLIPLLNARQLGINVSAAYALGEIGPAAAPAVPDLERLRFDPDPLAHEAAEAALEKIRRAP